RSLAVGGPSVERRLFPTYGPLPEAETEAQAVVKAHPGSKLLVRKDATVSNFLSALDCCEWIHVAAHAGTSPDGKRAALLFAPGPPARPPPAPPDVAETAPQPLPRPPLAALAACGAAGGAGLGLEGGEDLASSFLQAGVPAVVGNLWTLGDEEA